MNTGVSLDSVVHAIVNATNYAALNHTIRTSLPKDVRDTILSGPTSHGQDPLNSLDIRENTLGVLYIL